VPPSPNRFSHSHVVTDHLACSWVQQGYRSWCAKLCGLHNLEIVVRFRIVSFSRLRNVRTGSGGAQNLLLSGYRGIIAEGLSDHWPLTCNLVPRPKISGAIPPFPNMPASYSRYSSVRIVTKVRAGKRGFESRQCQVFYVGHRVHNEFCGPQSPLSIG
jgi:hypothetical protein